MTAVWSRGSTSWGFLSTIPYFLVNLACVCKIGAMKVQVTVFNL